MCQHGGRGKATHRASTTGEAGKRHKTETMSQKINDLKRKYSETKEENQDLKERTKVPETLIDQNQTTRLNRHTSEAPSENPITT